VPRHEIQRFTFPIHQQDSTQGPWESHPEDRVFRDFFFCNNYRQLDQATAYFHSQMIPKCCLDGVVVVVVNPRQRRSPTGSNRYCGWASYCFRLVNKVEFFFRGNAADDEDDKRSSLPTAKCFGRIPAIDEWTEFKKLVLKTQAKKWTFFTGAHQTCGFLNYVLLWMDTVHANPERLQQVGSMTPTHSNLAFKPFICNRRASEPHFCPGKLSATC
jgi:hypothetical protein